MSITAKETQEFYTETVNFKIVEWYIEIARSLVGAGEIVDMLRSRSVMDYSLINQAVLALAKTRRNIELFSSTLLTKADMAKVDSYVECKEKAFEELGRRVPEELDDRPRAFLQARNAIEVEYRALFLQHESLRDIAATNKWFQLSGRPIPVPGTSTLRYQH